MTIEGGVDETDEAAIPETAETGRGSNQGLALSQSDILSRSV